MLLSPEEAHGLAGIDRLPIPVAAVFEQLGVELKPNPALRRPAVTWLERGVAVYRPAGQEAMREALAHELGHVCTEHSGSVRWCGARAWESMHREEREAHAWSEKYLMPLPLLEPWIIDLGPRIRLSRVAGMCRVSADFARRRLRRAGLSRLVWDDTTSAVLRR